MLVNKKPFYVSLSEIQSRLVAPKGQFNAFGKYNYRSCEDILEAVKPLLKEFKMVLTIDDDIKMIGDRFYIVATATLTDGSVAHESKAMAREPLNKKGMDEAQITGSVSSYARKYALNGLFAIDDNKDTDERPAHVDEEKPLEEIKRRGPLIEMIKDHCGRLTKGMVISQKVEWLGENLQVDSMKRLEKWTIEKLIETIKKLEGMKIEPIVVGPEWED